MSSERTVKAPSPHPGPVSEERFVSGTHPRVRDPRRERDPDTELDLTAEQQLRFTALHASMKTMSFYDLLGVARTAGKRDIKRAYFERTREVHPDRFFGRRLGSFKAKLEAIFVRLTDAHDVLCSPERRAEYDAVLRTNRMSLVDAMLEDVAREMAGAEEAARREEIDASILRPVAPAPKKR